MPRPPHPTYAEHEKLLDQVAHYRLECVRLQDALGKKGVAKQKFYQQYLKVVSCLVDEMYKLEETHECRVSFTGGKVKVYHKDWLAGTINVYSTADCGDNDFFWYAEVFTLTYAPDQDIDIDEQHKAYQIGLTLEKRARQALNNLSKSYDIIWDAGGKPEC